MNPHVAYRDETNTNLKYAYYNGSSWINMTLDGNWGVDNVGEYVSLELDSGNWPHIAYYNATAGDLMYIYNDGSRGISQPPIPPTTWGSCEFSPGFKRPPSHCSLQHAISKLMYNV